MKIIFVCAGNMGRSPLGEALAKRRLAEALGTTAADLPQRGVEITSGGLLVPDGWKVSSRTVAVAAEVGLDIDGQLSHRITAAELEAADAVFCMDESNLGGVRELAPSAPAELLGSDEIPDPRFGDQDFFRSVRGQIDECIQARLPALLSAIETSQASPRPGPEAG